MLPKAKLIVVILSQVQRKHFFRLNTVAYTSSLVVCIISLIVTPILTDFKGRKLSCRLWLPYDYTAPLTFIVTYIYQSASIIMCALMNVASDCLFSGLLIHTYCLFEILGSRLKNIANDKNVSAKQCQFGNLLPENLPFYPVTDRVINSDVNLIISRISSSFQISLSLRSIFARMVNKEFKSIIFIQFVASTAVLCVELYRLTRRKLDSRFIDTIIYGSCSLWQILFYCWYGNEVREKSLNIVDLIIECNWTSFDNSSKKFLLMIMKRATIPIEFKSIYIASLNLASFMALLKTSYSVYNVLQRGQE
ncbi:odorant receptor Or1-like [Ptiloglossa arizonensis]|uniref:odorant receptor Or1-like n=1 Tax=Ptiloglossa arizonensis TaxID=3350558 RepID=UPI003F9ED3CD